MRVSVVRPLDIPAVRDAFRRSLAPARVHPTCPTPEILDAYQALCLDWFLTERTLSTVGVLHDEQHTVYGYVLICVAPDTYASWRRAALARYLRRVTPLLVGRPSGETARFVLLRALDDVTPWRRSPTISDGFPSARIHVVPGTPRLAAVHALAEFVDDHCAAGGFAQWSGEIDGAPTQLAKMVELGLGTDDARQTPHRTLGWLRGEEVDRLVFTRAIPTQPSTRDTRAA